MHGGIDEAGRGPVLGPLVVAGVACADPCVLDGLAIRDSKRLSPGKRERLARLLIDHDDVHVVVAELGPDELDARRVRHSLNIIEVEMFQDVARRLGARHIIVDAADVDALRFGRHIEAVLAGVTVQSEHKADDRHAIVGAASIIAKVHRDAAIDALRRPLERRLGLELGSGYPSDPKTQTFLAAWFAEYGDLPEGTRRSWKTVADLLAPKQSLLARFDATPA